MVRGTGSGRNRRLGAAWAAWMLAWVCVASPPTEVDPSRSPLPMPELASPVRTLLQAEYLSEEEKRDLRIRHGLWTPSDLDTPIRKAGAALVAGAFEDPSLRDPSGPVLVRARWLVTVGEYDAALSLLSGESSLESAVMRAEALAGLGRVEEAVGALGVIERAARAGEPGSVDDALAIAQGLSLRFDLAGAGDAAGDYQFLMALLGRARDRLDRLDWRVPLAEARLLLSRGNAPEAGEAIERVLSLNPRCAEAWFLIGMQAARNFDPARAEAVAARLDELAGVGEEGSRSAWGALVLAQSRLRQIDPEGALEVLSSAVERFPRMRSLLALRVAAAHAAFRNDDAARWNAEFDALSPGSPLALLEAGKALSDRRQYAAAAELLRQASLRAPFLPEPWIELGLLEVQSGRDALALQALERAAALDPFNARVANSLTLVRELSSYATLETPNFVVRHKPGVDEVLAREMLPELEAMHARVTGSERHGLDFAMPRSDDLPNGGRTVIELMPDHRWFSVRITGMPRVHTVAASTGPVIAMEAPRSGPNHLLGPYDWLRVVRHEYVHTVSLARSNNRLPHWFTEAAAVHLEDAPRDWNTVQLLARAAETGGLFDLDQINLAFVRPRRPTDRAQAYAQGAWMYEFIIDAWGPRAPLELMDHYGAGRTEAQAFQAVLGVGRGEFLERFKAWARLQLAAWGMRPPDGVPTLAELMAEDGGGPAGETRAPTPERLQHWLGRYPDHPEVLSLAVKEALSANGGEPAEGMIPLLERYAKARPVDPLPHRMLARLHLDAGRSAEALPHLEYLDAREQNSPALALELSKRYAALGQWERSWDKALRAVRIAPYEAAGREWAATVAIKRRDFDAAEWQIRALVRIEPHRPVHGQRLEALRKLRESGR